jgi:hypothetical protein
MSVSERHAEFCTRDMATGWKIPRRYSVGIRQKIVFGALAEEKRRGTRARLPRFQPGIYTATPFAHECRQDVYRMTGGLTVGSDARGNGSESFTPHARHAPANACSLLEAHSFDPPRLHRVHTLPALEIGMPPEAQARSPWRMIRSTIPAKNGLTLCPSAGDRPLFDWVNRRRRELVPNPTEGRERHGRTSNGSARDAAKRIFER